MADWWEAQGEWDPVDLDGDGVTDFVAATGSEGPIEQWDAGGARMFILDSDGDGDMEAIATDDDGDGIPEMTMTDRDGDGTLEGLETPWSGGALGGGF